MLNTITARKSPLHQVKHCERERERERESETMPKESVACVPSSTACLHLHHHYEHRKDIGMALILHHEKCFSFDHWSTSFSCSYTFHSLLCVLSLKTLTKKKCHFYCNNKEWGVNLQQSKHKQRSFIESVKSLWYFVSLKTLKMPQTKMLETYQATFPTRHTPGMKHLLQKWSILMELRISNDNTQHGTTQPPIMMPTTPIITHNTWIVSSRRWSKIERLKSNQEKKQDFLCFFSIFGYFFSLFIFTKIKQTNIAKQGWNVSKCFSFYFSSSSFFWRKTSCTVMNWFLFRVDHQCDSPI